MKKNGVLSKKKIYSVVLVSMLFLTVIFLNSFYWPYAEISKRKLLVGIIAFILVVIIPVLCAKITILYEDINNIIGKFKIVIERAKHNQKNIIVFLCALVLGIGLSGALTYLISTYILRTEFNVRMLYLILCIFEIVLLMVYAWKTASKKPEKVFFCIAIIVGLFCICATPNKVGISWDDQIHYQRTLSISNFLNGIMYHADEKNINEYVYQHIGYDRKTDLQYVEDMKNSYEARECNLYGDFSYGVGSVAYIPAAIGIILARGIGLSYIGVFNMGRIFSLLMYTLLIYFAIKRIKYGKILIATVGLLPPTIFMASSYSYDPWVTGFTILGFAYFFAELYEDAPLQNKNIIIMIGSFVIGCLPKAIYFALLFPLLFMPKKKFQSVKQRKRYYFAIVGGGLLLVASFLLPMLITGPGIGDIRGGEDVNSTEQIKYILREPLEYAKILLNFDLEYISMEKSGPMLQFLAYVGQGEFWGIVVLTLFTVSVLDKGNSKNNFILVKTGGVIGCALALALSTTALYISFTAVASETVAGMSGRYLIPLIFPALFSLGMEGTTHKINKNAFVCIPMLIIAVTFIYNISKVCVIGY